MPYEREEIEMLLRATDGRDVQLGDEETVGHFVVEPEVELDGAGVVGDVPTLVLPQMVPGIREGAQLSIDLTAEDLVAAGRPDDVPGWHPYRITRRMPGEAPGETRVLLREV